MSRITKTEKLAQLAVEVFNLKTPIGAAVLVWPMAREGEGLPAVTTTDAFVCGKGSNAFACIGIKREGKPNTTYALSNVEAVS